MAGRHEWARFELSGGDTVYEMCLACGEREATIFLTGEAFLASLDR